MEGHRAVVSPLLVHHGKSACEASANGPRAGSGRSQNKLSRV
jgi:hypothetical protein